LLDAFVLSHERELFEFNGPQQRTQHLQRRLKPLFSSSRMRIVTEERGRDGNSNRVEKLSLDKVKDWNEHGQGFEELIEDIGIETLEKVLGERFNAIIDTWRAARLDRSSRGSIHWEGHIAANVGSSMHLAPLGASYNNSLNRNTPSLKRKQPSDEHRSEERP